METIKEKAIEICNKHIFDSNHFDCCMEMALWKDEQYAWHPIPKDKDGFYDDLQKNLYDELPIIVMNKYDDGLYPSFEYICKDNWCDAVSDLSKPSYQYYMKIQEIPADK